MVDYQVCTRCIMDTSDPDIKFDQDGVCNHCKEYYVYVRENTFAGELGSEKLEELVREVKKTGTDKEYDCVIGLSGGVDSSYVAYKVKKLNLKPLAVHFDNGWDSELAVKNIENIVKTLDIDLQTYVVDWEEFKELQLAYLKAGVPNLEAPTDHGIWGAIYRAAAEKGIRYIISGHNAVTEGILPWSWGYTPRDWRQMRNIHRRFGRNRLETFPYLSLVRYLYYVYVKKIRRISLLNYFPYVKQDAMNVLKEELGWQEYGGKHCESKYTEFFQSYILPRRFNYDKRRAHLSTLICSGQISRERAIEVISREPYERDRLREDKDYVVKKLGLSNGEFDALMRLPIRSFRDYPSSRILYTNLPKMTRVLRYLGIRYH